MFILICIFITLYLLFPVVVLTFLKVAFVVLVAFLTWTALMTIIDITDR